MNKLTIPAILAATIMVAGIFAFMPVEQASTVHTISSSGLITEAETSTILDDASADTHTITYTFTDDVLVYGMLIELGTTESTDNYNILTVTVNGDALTQDAAFANPGANVDLDENWLQVNAFEQVPLAIASGNTIVLAIAEEDTTDGATDDILTVTFVYTANTGTTVSASAVVVT